MPPVRTTGTETVKRARVSAINYKRKLRLSIRYLQEVWKKWALLNFGPPFTPVPKMPYRALLGMQEELGELAHAHLKQEQKIRGTDAEHEAAAKDAIGDLFMYMVDYCNGRGWDLEEIIQDTADTVLRRDWKANPGTGEAG